MLSTSCSGTTGDWWWINCWTFQINLNPRSQVLDQHKNLPTDSASDELPLLPGDHVLVKNTRNKRGRKLEPKWECTLYRVEKKPSPPTSVYGVVLEGPNPIRGCLHRNLLRPCALSGGCSTKPAGDREPFHPADIPPVQEVPEKWYLPPLLLEPLVPDTPEAKSPSTMSTDSPATPESATDCPICLRNRFG